TLCDFGIDMGIPADAGDTPGTCETVDLAIHGSTGIRWFAWSEIVERPQGRDGILYCAVGRDITARKHAEQQLINARQRAEHASKAKSRFLATVSHEI